jgi:hypothetical protein
MSRFLFLRLLFILGNFIKNASHLVSCLTLLEEGNHSERVGRYHLVQVGKLFLVRALGCTKKICSLLSCAVGMSIVQRRYSLSR